MTRTPSQSARNNRSSGKAKPSSLRPLSLAVLLATSAWPALAANALPTDALPRGMQVVQGQAQLSSLGNQMTVRNSAGAILNWQDFSIGRNASVYFEQANSSSKVLNRVVGQDPSQILGQLGSNGQVWLLNPNGVLFGRDARVDVGSLVVSTLRLNDQDFLNQQYRFSAGLEGASLRNEGALRTSLGGQVILLSERIENAGQIETPQGNTSLAAARSVELVDTGAPNLSVRVSAPAGEVLNLGQLRAHGGSIDVHAASVNQQGLIRADQITTDSQGQIRIQASHGLQLTADSVTAADGAQGGTVMLDAGRQGTLMLAGQVSAQGQQGHGGKVRLLGQQVGLMAGSEVNVSGATGGGEVLVGGGQQGKDLSVPNARAVFMAPDAQLRADALQQGDGGRLILWSDEATRAFGRFSATGGVLGGNGGFVETSGGWLDARPAVLNLQASLGVAGTWLLDPNNIIISNSGPDTNITSGPNFTSTDNDAVISVATLTAALNAGTSVTVATALGGRNSQQGDISMIGASLLVAPSSAVSLTLNAHASILIGNSTIESSGAPLTLNLIAAGSGIGYTSIDSSLINVGGDIVFQGNQRPIQLHNSNLTTTGADGLIRFTSTQADTLLSPFTGAASVALLNTNLAASGARGKVELFGQSAFPGGRAVVLEGGSVAGLNVLVQGTTSGGGNGVSLLGSSISGTTVSLTGQGSAGVSDSYDAFGVFSATAPSNPSRGTSISAGRLVVNGQSDQNATQLRRAGINLTAGTTIALSGRQDATFTGDSIVLDRTTVTGNAASFSLNSRESQLVRRSTLDFTQGSGTNVRFLGDTDSLEGGRVRLELSSVRTGGGAIQISGVGRSFNQNTLISPSLARDGANGLYLADTLLDAGTGSVNVTGTSAFASGISLFGAGATSIKADSIVLNASGSRNLDGDGGINVGFDPQAPGKALNLQARTIDVTAAGQTFDPLDPRVSYALNLNALSTWTATERMTINAGAGGAVINGSLSAQTLDLRSTEQLYLENASLRAGGNLTLSGLGGSNPATGFGVRLAGSTLVEAANVDITGTSALGDGVMFGGNGGRVLATGNITVRGRSTDAQNNGVGVGGDWRLQAGDSLRIESDRSVDSLNELQDGNGLPTYIAGRLFETVVTNTTDAALLDSASALAWSSVLANMPSSSLVRLVKQGGSVSLAGQINTPSRLEIGVDDLTLLSGGGLRAAGTGDALVLRGSAAGTGMARFANQAGGSALQAPNGRWLAFLSDPRQSTLGGLVGDFSMLNLAASPLQRDGNGNFVTPLAGNAIGYSLAAASIAGGPLQGSINKVYDANTSFTLNPSNWTISGLLTGDRLSFSGPAGATVADKNVGANKAVSLAPTTQFSVVDANGRPVFGYQSPVFSASITPASLGLSSVTAQGKVFDGNTAASVTGTLTGVQGSDTVAALFAAQFTDASVGNNKTVSYASSLTGPDAANYQLPANVANGVTSASIIQPTNAPATTSQNLLSTATLATSIPVAMSTPSEGRVLDSTPGLSANGEVGFTSLNLSQMSRSEVITLLAARDNYKKNLFADALHKLKLDPALADVRPCANEAELSKGECLITESLKRAILSARELNAVKRDKFRKVKQAAVPAIERKVALLIGINDYTDRRIPFLLGAIPDARAVRTLLEDRLGYETVIVENASKEALIGALNKLALESGPNDSVMVYFAGHGEVVPSTGMGYWLPSDSRIDQPESWISNTDIGRLIGLIGAKQMMLISDSCYSGTLAGSEKVDLPGQRSTQDLLSRKAAVILSSGGNEPVADEGKNGHSVFAYHLMNALRELGDWQAGSDVFERLRDAVRREFPQTPQYGASRAAGHQGNTDYLLERREIEKAAQ